MSGLLLDTCTFIWLVAEPKKLSPRARRALKDADAIYLSDVCVWEICLKWQAQKIALPAPPRVWVEEQAERWNLSDLPITRECMLRITELPEHHRDPFDRLLVAQAIERRLTIVTPDEHIAAYPTAVLW